MLEIQAILLSIIFLCLFAKFKLGLSLYLAYFLLVPIQWTYIGGYYVSTIVINIILIIATVVDCSKSNTHFSFHSIKFLKPIFVLYFFYYLTLFLSSKISYSVGFRNWYDDVLSIFVLPCAILIAYASDKSVLKYIKTSLIVTFAIIFIYGIWLLTTNDVNPYVLLSAAEHGQDLQMGQFEFSRDNIAARVSSVFPHPMSYGLYLGLICIFLGSLLSESKKYIVGIVLSVIGIFSCGVRTPIAAFGLTWAFYLVMQKNYKLLVQASIVTIIGIVILTQIPATYEMVMSIFDSSENSSGSSLEMRYEQLSGCFDEISSNPLFGNGYSWTNAYMSANGAHPVCRAFESLLFVVLCNSGYIGIIIFTTIMLWLYRYIKNLPMSTEHTFMINSVLIFYLCYSLITGDYGYMKYCTLFLCIVYLNFKDRYNTIEQ